MNSGIAIRRPFLAICLAAAAVCAIGLIRATAENAMVADSRTTVTQDRMRFHARALHAYRLVKGTYPSGDNAQIVAELRSAQIIYEYNPTGLNEKGEVTSYNGKPLVFLFGSGGWCLVGVVNNAGDQIEECVTVSPEGKVRCLVMRSAFDDSPQPKGEAVKP
jgi:hypothetical protein